MATSTIGMLIKISADTKSASDALNRIDNNMNSFSRTLKSVGFAVAAAFSVKAITDFAAQSVAAASDLNEALNKSQVVFGTSAGAVKDFTDTAVTGLGLTRAQALEASGTFGNLLVSFGAGKEQATEMSTTLLQLAADLASFNNTSVEQAINALRSGLSGETEPLKKYGIVLQDTRLRAEALSQGLEVTTGVLDPMTKSLAAYGLIMKDSTTAQGDFERTSDGLANTQRILAAAVDDAKASIGQGLVNAIESATSAMGGSAGLAETIQEAGTGVGDLTRGVGLLVEKLAELTDQTDEATGAIGGAARAQTRFGDGQVDIIDKTLALIPIVGAWAIGLKTAGEVNRLTSEATQELIDKNVALYKRFQDSAAGAALNANSVNNLGEAYAKAAARADAFLDSTANRVFFNHVSTQVKGYGDIRRAAEEAEKSAKKATSGGGGSAAAKEAQKNIRDLAIEWRFLGVEVEVAAKKATESTVNSYNTQLDQLKAAATAYTQTVKAAIADTQAAVDNYRSSLNEKFLGVNLDDFITTDENGTTFFDSAAWTDWIGEKEDIRAALAPLIGNIPQAWAEEILGMGGDAARATLNWITDSSDEVAELQRNMSDLASRTEETLTGPMSEAMRSTFWEAQQEGIDAAKQKVKEEAKEFKAWVRSKLKTKVTIDVEYREINSPPAAAAAGSAVRQVQQFEALNGKSWRV